MKMRIAIPVALGGAIAGSCLVMPFAQAQIGNTSGDIGISGAIEQKLILTPDQRKSIYEEVSKDKSKVSPQHFSPVVGADVPPMIELYSLPDDALAKVPAAKIYKYTMVENKLVVVDPTKMRVIDVIGPAPER